MVLRLGAVSGVGHARLILERFGRFWGAFSVIDLLVLNALTIVTEFIGISLALDFFGLSKIWGVSWTLGIGIAAAIGIALRLALAHTRASPRTSTSRSRKKRAWRMPPLGDLPPAKLSALDRIWLVILRTYLLGAAGAVILKVTLIALHRG